MARKIEVDLVANAKPFNNTLDAAVGKVTGFSSRLKAMGGGSIGRGLAIGAGVASFNLLTSAVSAAVGQMDEMHQAFLDDEASQARLQAVLKNTTKNFETATKSVEAFAAAKLEMGFDDAGTRDSIGQLVGVVGGDIPKALELANLAMDLSRAKNIDLAQATDAVTKGYLGQGRAIQALGIDLRGAASGAEIIQRTLQNVRGAQEAYAKTGAGRVAAANVKMQETMEKLGGVIDKVSQVIIPIMVDGFAELVDIAGDFIGIFTQVADFVAGKLSNAFALFGQNVQGTVGWLATLRDVGKLLLNGVLPGSVGLGGTGGGGGGGGGIDVGNLQPGQSQNIGVWDTGGVVGGPPGSHSLAIVAAGERLTMPGQANAGQTIIVNIASFIGSDRDIDRFADRLAFRLRSTSLG